MQVTDEKTGLTGEQVRQRLAQGLDNRVTAGAGPSAGQIILRNCVTFFNLVFVVMAVLLLLAGSTVKNLTFLVVVIINTVIGCVQQLRAKMAVDRLTLVADREVAVLRDGQWIYLHSPRLVRDDVIRLKAGDQLCADARVLQGQLYVNEALLTGEADSVEKNPADPLLSGSFVVAGSALAQLTRVGNDAFAARLAAEAKKNPKVAKPEMLRSLDQLIRFIGLILIPVGALLFAQQYWLLSVSLGDSAESTVAALVGMIPEGLYLLTSIALAASALKLAKQQVLVRDMNGIETLARVDVLCVDKTGTITTPQMQVTRLVSLGEDPALVRQVLWAMYGQKEPENDTGKALAKYVTPGAPWDCTRYIPFRSETKWAGGEFSGHGTYLVGAPEVLLRERYEAVYKAADLEPGRDRVLLCARYAGSLDAGQPEAGRITPLAFVVLSNQVRPSAAQTFSYFTRQGVAVKVISGDDPRAAARVAVQAGIPHGEDWVDTTDLETWEDFVAAARRYSVFGRVTPEKKRQLIRALQAQKHTVAMTGDGVNDVLAMKQADCAIAMAGGAQAASQVAQLVLLNDDFSAMPALVAEGRRVINNIQRAAALFLVKNIFSLGLSLLGFFTGLPYPMMPLHMSIISGLTIGVPSFFLAMEPNEQQVRGRFLPGVLRRALPGGITDILMVLAAQLLGAAFSLPAGEMSAVCTAVLAFVGMLVLYRVCTPFDKFRRVVWFAMVAALVGCFTVLGGFLELQLATPGVLWALCGLLAAAPVVFMGISKLFSLYDRLRKKEGSAC